MRQVSLPSKLRRSKQTDEVVIPVENISTGMVGRGLVGKGPVPIVWTTPPNDTETGETSSRTGMRKYLSLERIWTESL